MSIDYSKSAISKGKTRKQLKAKKDRAEAKQIKIVRAKCVIRDGFCRFHFGNDDTGGMLSHCIGPSAWCHLEDYKRARTRGMVPERRHTTAGSAMLCTTIHEAYDSGRLVLEFLTDRGADGPIRWSERR